MGSRGLSRHATPMLFILAILSVVALPAILLCAVIWWPKYWGQIRSLDAIYSKVAKQ